MVTLNDVAKRAGVSKTTVSRMLNKDPSLSITTATKERIWLAVKELGYQHKRTCGAASGYQIAIIHKESHYQNQLDNALYFAIRYGIGYAATYGYTVFLWNDTNLSNVALAAVSLWIVGFLYLSILMIGCVIFKQTFTSILFTGGIVALISLLGMIEPIAKFNPFILTSKNVDLISGEAVPAEFMIPAFISVTLSIFGVLIAIRLFNKKQL